MASALAARGRGPGPPGPGSTTSSGPSGCSIASVTTARSRDPVPTGGADDQEGAGGCSLDVVVATTGEEPEVDVVGNNGKRGNRESDGVAGSLGARATACAGRERAGLRELW